jgi:hypothetical protein
MNLSSVRTSEQPILRELCFLTLNVEVKFIFATSLLEERCTRIAATLSRALGAKALDK